MYCEVDLDELHLAEIQMKLKKEVKERIINDLIKERNKYIDFDNRKTPSKEYYGFQKAIKIVRKIEEEE